MSDSDEKKAQKPDSQPDEANEQGESGGASRREFIKKVAYVAPVIETFLLSETAYGQGKSQGSQARGRGRGRGRRRVSPVPPNRTPPPPPPQQSGRG